MAKPTSRRPTRIEIGIVNLFIPLIQHGQIERRIEISVSSLFGFLHFENLVYLRAGDLLATSGWPENFDICPRGRPESKMQPFVTGREITSSRGGEPHLPVYLHARSQPIAVASGTAKADGNPVISICLVHEHLRRASEHGHDHVDVAIIN